MPSTVRATAVLAASQSPLGRTLETLETLPADSNMIGSDSGTV